MEELKNNNLTLKNYKYPLKAVPKKQGFGYYGAIIVTLDGSGIQCHICGKLFTRLGLHSYQSHKLTASEYKEKFQLSPQTALISEVERNRLKDATIVWREKMKEKYGEDYITHFREISKKGAINSAKKSKDTTWTESLENKNKKGTCPDQLLDKIHEVAKKVGHTPSLNDFIRETDGQRYKHLIFATFGSWKNALRMAKLQPKMVIQNGGKRNYTDEILIEYLEIFAQENNRIPTSTDCKRGLIPFEETYRRHFGSLPKAREKADLDRFIN